MRQRIAVYVPAFDGGGEKVMVDLARAFRDCGHEVDLVCAATPAGEWSHPGIPDDVRLVVLGAGGIVSRVRKTAGYLKAEQPAAVFSFYDFANTVALAARLSGARSIVVAGIHNNLSALFRPQRGLKAVLRRTLLPLLLRMAVRVVAVSAGVADDLARLVSSFRGRIHVIYNPVPPDLIRAAALENVSHPFLVSDQPLVLTVGHLKEREDFGTLLRAFSAVRREIPARLLILGEGSKRAGLSTFAIQLGVEEDISMPGFDPNPFAFMARSSVFVLSSRFEGFGLVLAEALSVGLPVVSTDCPSGPAEILEHGRYGRLVPVGDVQAMAAPSLRYCVNRTFRRRGASNASTRIWWRSAILQCLTPPGQCHRDAVESSVRGMSS